MPRVALTAAQREAAKIADRHKALSDGLLIYKAVNRITFAQQAKALGINPRRSSMGSPASCPCLPSGGCWTWLGFLPPRRRVDPVQRHKKRPHCLRAQTARPSGFVHER